MQKCHQGVIELVEYILDVKIHLVSSEELEKRMIDIGIKQMG